ISSTYMMYRFFFSSRSRHTRFSRDWSSDVCSSDLEHHRADFAVSAPETVLAAIAARTSRIRLGSAVTVLSSDDPIRVFQRFSTRSEEHRVGKQCGLRCLLYHTMKKVQLFCVL